MTSSVGSTSRRGATPRAWRERRDERLEQQFGAARAERGDADADRGEWRIEKARDGDVVEAGDGHLAGHVDARLAEKRERADRHRIVRREDRRRRLAATSSAARAPSMPAASVKSPRTESCGSFATPAPRIAARWPRSRCCASALCAAPAMKPMRLWPSARRWPRHRGRAAVVVHGHGRRRRPSSTG